MKLIQIKFLSAFFFIFLLDQLTKRLARTQGLVTFNTGISLSLFEQQSVFVNIFVTTIGFFAILYYFGAQWQKSLVISGFFCAAVLSNVLDRMMFGGVQDFLTIPFFQLKNNIADYVIFGCLMWLGWRSLRTEGQE